jgi:hypothetical protein
MRQEGKSYKIASGSFSILMASFGLEAANLMKLMGLDGYFNIVYKWVLLIKAR